MQEHRECTMRVSGLGILEHRDAGASRCTERGCWDSRASRSRVSEWAWDRRDIEMQRIEIQRIENAQLERVCVWDLRASRSRVSENAQLEKRVCVG